MKGVVHEYYFEKITQQLAYSTQPELNTMKRFGDKLNIEGQRATAFGLRDDNNCIPSCCSSWRNRTAITPYCFSRLYNLLRSMPKASAART